MLDRLTELRSRNRKVEPSRNESQLDLNANRSSAERYEENTEGISSEFFECVRNSKGMITRIRDNNERIQEYRLKYARAIKTSHEKEISEELNAIVAENQGIHSSLKTILSDMKVIVEEAEHDEQQQNQPETRMKRNFYMSLTNELTKVLEEQRIQEDGFRNTVKDKIGRQVRMVDPNLTDDAVENYVNNPLQAEQMLQKKIYGQASVGLRNAVSDIQDKFRDIQRLERSVAECLQLFKELAVLVAEQGTMIDNIELNVNQTKDYMEKAEKHLKKAKEHHQCAKKYMWWIILAGVIILVIIIVPIIVTSTQK